MGYLNSIVLVISFLVCCGVYIANGSGNCPPPNKVHNDKPVCFSDADCQKWGKVCCRNQHNTKSCVDRAPWRNMFNNDDKHNGYARASGAGVYCAGVKCRPYEVCKPDAITKRLRCQRS